MYQKIGYSLLEMMITLALCMIVSIVMTQWLACVARDWLVVDQIAKTIERGRAVTGLFEQAIYRAGFLGCQSILHTQKLGAALPHILEQPAVILHANNQEFLTLFPEYAYTQDAKFPQLIINKAIGHPLRFHFIDQQRRILHLQDAAAVQVGERFVIDDCAHHQFVQVRKIHAENFIEFDSPIAREFSNKMKLSAYQSEHFYIGRTQRRDSTATPIFALHHHYLDQHVDNNNKELVDRVDNMDLQWISAQDSSRNTDVLMMTVTLRSEQSIIEGTKEIQIGQHTQFYEHPYLFKKWRNLYPLPQRNPI